jgi:hypothetical protein
MILRRQEAIRPEIVPEVVPEERYERRRHRSRGGFCCPYCQTDIPPHMAEKISTAGWVIFAVLLIGCFPLCFIGLLIKEDYRICSQCGIKLG